MLDASDSRLSRAWFGLAYVALLSAGAFAIAIVLARVPVLDRYVGDPGLFKRCLVVHVTFALCLWFYAFLAALYHRVPGGPRGGRLGWTSIWLAVASYVAIMIGAGIRGAEPLLVNYIPIIDTPVFVGGLALFGLLVALPMLDGRLWRTREASGDVHALRAASVAYLIALVTFALTWTRLPEGLSSMARAELTVWGGGHVLQFASVLGMVAAWELLLSRTLGHDRRWERAVGVLTTLLVLPLALVLFYAVEDPAAAESRVFFTRLMRWGIFPAVTLLMVLTTYRVVTAVRARGAAAVFGDGRVVALLVSMALTATGFILGALIRGDTTMVPGHYHASIGGVTVAYMGASFVLLEDYGRLPRGRFALRVARLQPVVYGLGQLAFALGFALAGAHGMQRKVYGAEQQIRTLGETVGLGAMGIGGLVAIVGGVMLLSVVVPALVHVDRSARRAPGRISWPMVQSADTRSRS